MEYKFHVKATQLFSDWSVVLRNITDTDQQSLWQTVTDNLKLIPEIKDIVEDSSTRYYSSTLDILVPTFSNEQLQSIFTKDKEGYESILIVPKTFHIDNNRPIATYVQIEGEKADLWLLHKTDVTETGSYFDQLHHDVKHALSLCDTQRKANMHQIPALALNSEVKYRFFTSSSETAEKAKSCQEIAPANVDAYLKQGNQIWVIRTNASVETECALKHRSFGMWRVTEAVPSESKIQIVEEEDEKEKVVTFGDAIPVPEEKKVLEQPSMLTRMMESIKAHVPSCMLPSSSKSVVPTTTIVNPLRKLSGKIPTSKEIWSHWKQAVDNITPKTWKANNDSSDIALYFALAIIAVVFLAIIIITSVLVLRNKKSKLVLNSPPDVPLPSTPFSGTVAYEQESSTNKQPSHYDIMIPEEDLGSEEEPDQESDLDEEEQKNIKQIIVQENKHYPEAKSIEYTRKDMEYDMKNHSDIFKHYSAQKAAAAKSSVSTTMKDTCGTTSGACSKPETLRISIR